MSDSDRQDIIKNELRLAFESCSLIGVWFESINSPDAFVASIDARKTLSAICMQLIVIGETVSRIKKQQGNEYLANYDGIDWRSVVGLRNVLAHNYFQIDIELVYEICDQSIPSLKKVIERMLANIEKDSE